MRMTLDDNNAVFVQPVASASTIVSSLTAEIREFISKQFPRGYFKHVHINTSEPVVSIRQNDLYNKHAGKHPYPRLIVTPEITLDDPIFGMDKPLHMSSPNMYLRKDMKRFYTPLLTSPNKDFAAYFTSDYVTVNYNFQIVVDKFIQNVDLAYFLKSTFQNSMFKHLDGIRLNTEIPKTVIAMVAHLSGYEDIFNEVDEMDVVGKEVRDGTLVEFEKYMMEIGHLKGLVKKKIREATGKVGFFADHEVTVTGGVFDLDAPTQINRDGMNEGEYVITFRFQASTWVPNAFILSVDRNSLIKQIDKDYLTRLMAERESFGILGIESENVMSTSFRISGLRRKDTDYFVEYTVDAITGDVEETQLLVMGEPIIGQEIINQVYTFSYDELDTKIDFANMISGDVKKVYIYALDNGLEIRDIINIRLEDESGPVPMRITEDSNDRHSYIDYENLEIDIRTDSPKDINFRMFLNRPLFEIILENIRKSRYFSLSNHLGYINYDIEDEEDGSIITYKVRVLAFKTREEFMSDSPDMRLRTMTPWGVGYIETVPVYYGDPGDVSGIPGPSGEYFNPEEDGIKIVVGEYPNGDPIVRKLVIYEIIEN